MDFIQEMGIKDLESLVLKAHDNMYLGNRYFEQGEPILYFQNIQIAVLAEQTQLIAARGGYLNQARVVWEDRNDTTFQFSNGTLNQLSLNLLLEANMIKQDNLFVPYKQIILLDENAQCNLDYSPAQEKKQFYNLLQAQNLQKSIKPLSISDKTITFSSQYADEEVLADYYFKPERNPITYTMNKERKTNLYSLEATFVLKDENEGLYHTGIIEMPKVYIMSNINLRMGERADPAVGTFRIVAMPEQLDNSESTVCRITYLQDDIYGL